MKRERLTHVQRREQTRERLLEAARIMFLKKGLTATSVEDIAAAAGYTRGAFYSNFGSKPELLIELLWSGTHFVDAMNWLRELSTAGRRVACHDHDVDRRWVTRHSLCYGAGSSLR